MTKKLEIPNVGEILKSEFIQELGISQNELARQISVPPNRIHEIVGGKRKMSADTDLRLCKLFKLSEGYFLRLQVLHDTAEAKRKNESIYKKILPIELRSYEAR